MRMRAVATGLALVIPLGVPAASSAAQPGHIESGAYKMVAHSGGLVYRSTWTLKVKGGAITGSSKWTCCPGPRVDPLDGRVAGSTMKIHRNCSNQGQTACARQTFAGQIVADPHNPAVGTWIGRWSGDGATGGDQSFTMKVRLETNVVLSGRVVDPFCADQACRHVKTVASEGSQVVVSGAGGTKRAVTNHDGDYKVVVVSGRHTVRLAGRSDAQPSSRTLVARHDTSGLDFEICRTPAGYHGTGSACPMVEIDGQVVDAKGAPYGSFDARRQVTLSVPGDETTANADGRFVLFVERGETLVQAEGYGAYPTLGSEGVNATHKVNTVRVTLPPKFGVSGAGPTDVFFQIDGLPATPLGLTVTFGRDVEGTDQSCQPTQRSDIERTASRADTAIVAPAPPFSAFCSGTYFATLNSGSAELGSTTFTIP